MSTSGWMVFWFWWLIAVLVSFLMPELSSVYFAKGPKWTLSDCIRRWAAAHRWIPMVVAGAFALLYVHFFGMTNR